ncbi:iron-containing alcohol dehydrogenase family protein [Paenibacillus sp. P96]|uniref:Iron-containing alcohol dehydrogenase family protein n=1 Tax=Paenibacillus zeirhizosphaerae TaxID=2987519 RepID=A0ABT9FQX6_9BACL|nr:iron-containing alcohol dehydrogenase family protein [Paenibacillus sp. P96]MDP4097074.1 iron-containing alcohol dehydrogenase family protein [Paenibacillus sp. P96]
MISVKAPDHYWNEPDILLKSGPLIAPYGKNAFVVTGQKALNAVGHAFFESLKQAGIAHTIASFGGKVTIAEIEVYTAQASAQQADVIIGVGGGKALDLAKAVGGKLRLPVIAVPTIAATCASWAAVSILYDDLGRSSEYLMNERSPALVLVDTRVIASAPKRYLASGIGDTIVKWYEIAVNLSEESGELDIQIAGQTAKLALDRLRSHALAAYETAGSGKVTPALTETINDIIVLAGLAGTVQGSKPRAAIAHAIHNSLTFVHQTSDTLHGEKVAFGLLAQTVLEGRAGDEIDELAVWLHSFGLPITLRGLGITGDSASITLEIAKRVQLREDATTGLAFAVNEASLAEAIQQADQWGQRIQQESVYANS